MADYTDIATVEGVLRKGVKIDDSTTDPPTRANVAIWITLLTNQVNVAYASGGATTPITDPDTLGMLKLLCAREIAYQVLATRGLELGEDAEEQGWHDEFKALMASASEGEAAATVTAGGSPTSYTMNSPSDDDPSINPVIERGKEY
jgi:hypothetical protein